MYPAYQRYQTTQISTSDPKTLVVMLFDRLLLACRKARDAAVRGDVPLKGKEVNRAQAILHELNLGLNREAAPELSGNLARIYDYCLRQITSWHVANRPEGLESVERSVRELRDAFAQAFGVEKPDKTLLAG